MVMKSPAIPTGVCVTVAVILLTVGTFIVSARGAQPENRPVVVRYSIPVPMLEKEFTFCGERIPLRRPDVRSRIESQINFLLLDARSVLTEWLSEKARFAWLFEEILAKEGLPKDLSLLPPVIAGLNIFSSSRGPGVGWWSLTSACTASEGTEMSVDSWHDDRMDLELSTRCFVARVKDIRKEIGGQTWLMVVAAYLCGTKPLQELEQRWNTQAFWDLPLPDAAEELVVRWIALGIIDANRAAFGLRFKESPPLTFDQVTGLVLTKDLSLAEIAKLTGTPAREILLLNPKVKAAHAVFPATVQGKRPVHTLAAPKGKGQLLVNQLHKLGYLAEQPKR
jgi:membrane-bound lytic murein transglycosylase D